MTKNLINLEKIPDNLYRTGNYSIMSKGSSTLPGARSFASFITANEQIQLNRDCFINNSNVYASE